MDVTAKVEKPRVQSRKKKAASAADLKNWEYSIRPIDNGFMVRKSWRGSWHENMTDEQRNGSEKFYEENPLKEIF